MATSGRTAAPTASDRAVEIDARLAPSGLEAALRSALRDPTLELALWIAERETFVDVEARPDDAAIADAAVLEAVCNASGAALDDARRQLEPVAPRGGDRLQPS